MIQHYSGQKFSEDTWTLVLALQKDKTQHKSGICGFDPCAYIPQKAITENTMDVLNEWKRYIKFNFLKTLILKTTE